MWTLTTKLDGSLVLEKHHIVAKHVKENGTADTAILETAQTRHGVIHRLTVINLKYSRHWIK